MHAASVENTWAHCPIVDNTVKVEKVFFFPFNASNSQILRQHHHVLFLCGDGQSHNSSVRNPKIADKEKWIIHKLICTDNNCNRFFVSLTCMNETPLEQKTKYRAGILFMGNRLDRCHLRLLCSHVIDRVKEFMHLD